MALTKFETELKAFGESDWAGAIAAFSPQIHEVDRDATEIWFAFYPLALHQYIENAEELEKELQGFAMQGQFRVSDGIDDSHSFMYGHRFWPSVKSAVTARAKAFEGSNLNLENEIESLAGTVAEETGADDALLIGIVAVGLMTLRQTGLESFSATVGDTVKPSGLLNKKPAAIVAQRKKEPSQGFFGFLKTIDKEFEVTWDENEKAARFKIFYGEEVASGAARDQSRDWGKRDSRCIEGVIPVECRSAACGTCWVGVVAGAENLSDVQRLERKQMKVFGYRQNESEKPNLRLACQARVEGGSVTIVLPKWNGVFGKKVYGVDEVRLEPATTAAAKLRETIAGAMSEDN